MDADSERCLRAAALRAEGKKLKEIGRLVGRQDDPSQPISIVRAQAMIYKAARIICARPGFEDHPLRQWARWYTGRLGTDRRDKDGWVYDRFQGEMVRADPGRSYLLSRAGLDTGYQQFPTR